MASEPKMKRKPSNPIKGNLLAVFGRVVGVEV
jgi:hypothetical protein